jgi:tungstate transport system substrate-binding protein
MEQLTRNPVAGMAAVLTAVLLLVPAGAIAADAPDQRPVVRLAAVNTPLQSGLLAALLPDFEKACGCTVQVFGGNAAFEQAELGEADLVIAHYGKAETESFVSRGLGTWPHPVFSNQMVLVGPPGDPAGVRGTRDPFAAMKKIADSRSAFVCGADAGSRYLCELLLAGAGNPARGAWYVETALTKGQVMKFAEERGAYTVWGSFPFERFRRNNDSALQVMVWDTPIFHRVMATVVVNPERFPDANVAGARALEAYLLSPAVQAAVAAFREQGLDRQTWWPAARNNNPARLLGLDPNRETDE